LEGRPTEHMSAGIQTIDEAAATRYRALNVTMKYLCVVDFISI
jgi:hypothetical protein